ncbi:MAG: type IV pilus biogenesis protein PilM, partial [Planctomycetota bacterium]
MALVKRKHKYVAIDYDRRRVRLVIFECGGRKFSILGLHTAGIAEDVDPADAASLGVFLGNVVEELGLRGTRAIMCVGRSQAVLKSLSLPPSADPNELASMVQFQVGKELPFSADEAVVDYTRGAHWGPAEVADGDEEGTSVLAAAVRLPVIEAAREICRQGDLKLERLGLRPYANLRAVYRSVRAVPGERILLVDLTADEAEINVMRNRTLEFSRSAAVGSTAAPGPPDGLVRRLVSEVTRSLQSFHAVQHGGVIDACLVAGDTGLERDVTRALTERLGVRCEKFAPAGGFSISSSQAVGGFAAALGLAAGQADESLPFDFLDPKRPVPPRDRRKVVGGAIAAAAAVLLAGGVFAADSYFSARADTVEQLSDQQEKLKKNKQALGQLKRRVDGIDQWLAAQQDWLAQLRFLSESLPSSRRVYVTSLRFSQGKISLIWRAKDRKVAAA